MNPILKHRIFSLLSLSNVNAFHTGRCLWAADGNKERVDPTDHHLGRAKMRSSSWAFNYIKLDRLHATCSNICLSFLFCKKKHYLLLRKGFILLSDISIFTIVHWRNKTSPANSSEWSQNSMSIDHCYRRGRTQIPISSHGNRARQNLSSTLRMFSVHLLIRRSLPS
jgi:hypothetical protein